MCHSFFSKEKVSFNFVAAATVHSDFEAQENKICHCFHFLPIYLPWSDGPSCHNFYVLNVGFWASFFTPLSPSSRGFLVPLWFLTLKWYLNPYKCIQLVDSNLHLKTSKTLPVRKLIKYSFYFVNTNVLNLLYIERYNIYLYLNCMYELDVIASL